MLDKIIKIIKRIIPDRYIWILDHKGFRRYFSNTSWMFSGRVFSLVFSFFVGAWVARYLGPENYGILSYSIAFAGLFGYVSSLGVDGILSRELVAFPEKRDELMGTAFRLKMFGGILAFLLSVVAVLFFEGSHLIRILVVIYSLIFILLSFDVISTFFQSGVEARRNVRASMMATIVSSVLKIILIYYHQGIIWFMVVGVFDVVWQSLYLLRAYRRSNLKIMAWRFDRLLAKKILLSSWPLMLSSVSYFIYVRIDQIMIGAFLGGRAVGLYAVAVKLVEISSFLPGIICASLFPAIVNAKKTSASIYKKRLKALYLLLGSTSFLIALISTILAPWVVALVFGREYLPSIAILRIYAWSGIGLSVGAVINQYFLSESKSNHIFFYNLFSMLANVALNLILIPRIGLPGAAWATLISYSAGPIVVGVSFLFAYLKNIRILGGNKC